jgi:hypothetical protein
MALQMVLRILRLTIGLAFLFGALPNGTADDLLDAATQDASGIERPHRDAKLTVGRGTAAVKSLGRAAEIFFDVEQAEHWYSSAIDRQIWRTAVVAWHEKLLDVMAQHSVAEAVKPAVEVVGGVVNPASVTVPANVIYVRFSKSFLRFYFCKRFEKDLPVRDTILGAAVRGTSRTLANTELELIENPKDAQAKLFFKGITTFNTTSYSGPVQIHSRGTTKFTSQKKVWFDGLNVAQSTPTTSAESDTTTTGITTSLPRLRGRIALRIAGEEVAANRRLAEQITSERTKRRIEQAFEKVARERAAEFTQALREQYAKLPLDGRFALSEIQCSTTPDALQIVVIGRGEKDQTFAEAPAALDNRPDIEVHVHTALLQKIVVSAELRKTLQKAVLNIVERPLAKMVKGTTASTTAESGVQPALEQPERELKLHWTEGENLPWLSLAWYEKEPNGEAKQAKTGRISTATPNRK